MHKEADEQCSDQEGKNVQRRPIACVACARAKTKCDKIVSNPFAFKEAFTDNDSSLPAVDVSAKACFVKQGLPNDRTMPHID